MQALIITGGSLDGAFILDYIKKESYDVTIAVDHGLGFFYENQLIPDYIVGDFDSVASEILQHYEKTEAEITRLNPQKDDTDTEHALHLAMDMGCEKIHIFGATGTRLDHVLGNLQLLGFGLRNQVECLLIDPYNRIRLINQEITLNRNTQFGKYVSLIPYTPRVTGLSLTGFAYPLEDYTMSSFYMEDAVPISGVSNEIVEETARISFQEGILVLVESRDEK